MELHLEIHGASSRKSCRHILDNDLIYRPDFLFETITNLIKHWKMLKKILIKIFDNLLLKILFPNSLCWNENSVIHFLIVTFQTGI